MNSCTKHATLTAARSKGYKVSSYIITVVILLCAFSHFSGLHYALVLNSSLFEPIQTFYPGAKRLPGATHLYSSCINLANIEYIMGVIMLITAVFMLVALSYKKNYRAAQRLDFAVRRIWLISYLIYTTVAYFAQEQLFAVSSDWSKIYEDAFASYRVYPLVFCAILGVLLLSSYLSSDRYYTSEEVSA